MHFGKVPEALLQTINFSLPEEPITNKLVLSAIKTIEPKVYIGCAKWGSKVWVDKLYPKKQRRKIF